MNKVLTERFLSLVPQEHRTTYKVTLSSNPNKRFGDTFQLFYEQFGIEDEMEIETNKEEMKRPWSLAEGFEALKTRFNDGIAYASFANQPISVIDALNMLLMVLVKTGNFQQQYED